MLEKRDNACGSCQLSTKGKREGPIPIPGCIGDPGPVYKDARVSLTSSSLMTSEVFNANPTIVATAAPTARRRAAHSLWLSDDEDSDIYDSDDEPEPIDADEIFGMFLSSFSAQSSSLRPFSDLIRSISDPEHRSMTLEQLAVVSAPQITVAPSRILIEFTPTVPHCGMSTLIGLSIRVRLLRALPTRFKVDIRVKPGSHQSEHAGQCGSAMSRWLCQCANNAPIVNKQLNDKERVAAALENPSLVEVLETCLQGAERRGL